MEILRIVENSELSIRQALKEFGIHRSTIYNWYRKYLEDGLVSLKPKKPKVRTFQVNPLKLTIIRSYSAFSTYFGVIVSCRISSLYPKTTLPALFYQFDEVGIAIAV
ncbi:MAG: helix-turn-helix domain-containing protein [Nitrospinae bacterium]|nr:helix-turn-helix domain-containing protein [Nitrospinota bacterium]MZH46272.1 helix-turn-helix domain-containing protein [Nitrospinota bacterium]